MPPIELMEKRTRNSKTHHLGGRKFSWDGIIGSVHYEDNGWHEIDNYFEPAVAPWDWQMLHAGYHIRVKEDFTAGQIIEFEKQGETVQFQPMALEWTNDLDQIQPIAMPHEVAPNITNPEVDLLPTVGMPSHQGTIRWDDAYGEGIDFEWKCSSTRLIKILEIENLNKLPEPEQFILDGGNPVLRLNLIFDPSDLDIYVDSEVWDKKAKKQTFKVIEFRKDGEVLWGFMPLRYWGSGQDEDNEGQSIATLEKRGNKLYISIRVPFDWLQSAIYPVFIDTDVDEQVGLSLDDVKRGLSADSWYPTSTTNTAGAETSTNYRWGVGLRFQTVAIEPDISTSYLIFKCKQATSGTTVRTRISAEDVDDAPTFADDKSAFDARWAARTTARVDWDAIPAWSANEEGEDTTSPEIKTVIQEIVEREGWASGQDIVIFWEDFEDRSTHGTGCSRRAYSWDSSTDYCPKLHIEYEEAAPEVEGGAQYIKMSPFGIMVIRG